MGLFSKDIKTMDDLFVHQLQDIYYAEQQITKALPEMIEKASDPQLKQAFQTHLGETQQQIQMNELSSLEVFPAESASGLWLNLLRGALYYFSREAPRDVRIRTPHGTGAP